MVEQVTLKSKAKNNPKGSLNTLCKICQQLEVEKIFMQYQTFILNFVESLNFLLYAISSFVNILGICQTLCGSEFSPNRKLAKRGYLHKIHFLQRKSKKKYLEMSTSSILCGKCFFVFLLFVLCRIHVLVKDLFLFNILYTQVNQSHIPSLLCVWWRTLHGAGRSKG